MKIKVVIVVLAVACVGLAIALIATKKHADDQHSTDVSSISEFSNQVVSANGQINEIRQVNLSISNELSASQQQLTVAVESLTQMSNTLASANATLTDTKTTLATTQDLVTNLNNRISSLETRNRELDQQVSELTNALARLNGQIEQTKTELAIAQTNRDFLQGELQKQLAAKAELEHKFNDLDELRSQVKHIRDEMFVTRRLLLSRNDNSGKKGAELLITRTVPSHNTKSSPSNYELNVEVGSDGSVKVIPPLGNTNAPAH